MATVNAFIRTNKKGKEVNVRFRLRDGRSIQLFHTSELTILPDDWDNKSQSIKSRVLYDEQKRVEFNVSVNNRKSLIHSIYAKIEDKENFTSKDLDLAIDEKLYPDKYNIQPKNYTLFSFIDEFIQNAPFRRDKVTGRKLVYNNIQQYRATYKHLQNFAALINKVDFNFEEITQAFYNEFVLYLQQEQHQYDDKGNLALTKKRFTQNTVGKHIRILKLFLNEATDQGVNKNAAYTHFYVFTEDVDTVYLNEEELNMLESYDFSDKPYLDRVRDWFLLLAWTGSRFSDLTKIKASDINDDFITFRQQKTNSKVTIPLHPVVKSILDKYDFNMPTPISNQRFNEFIKEVVKIAGINSKESITRTEGGKLITFYEEKWKLISSHTGRRSFCTNMYKRGLPTLMIRSISGHKTEKSFLKYIKVKQEEHAQMMKEIWNQMYTK